jgi:hypothetical protein
MSLFFSNRFLNNNGMIIIGIIELQIILGAKIVGRRQEIERASDCKLKCKLPDWNTRTYRVQSTIMYRRASSAT